MRRRRLRQALLFGAVIATLACGATTKLSTVWNTTATHPPVRRLMVIGVSENPSGRRSFEDAFVAALQKEGVEAAQSYLFLPSDGRLEESLVKKVVREREIEAVIVTRLLDVEKEQQYVPPTTTYAPRVGYRGYYGYYGASYDVVTSPGYWRTATTVKMETQIYDSVTADLIWAAQSDTFDPSSTDDVIQSVTKAITKRLASDGLLAGS